MTKCFVVLVFFGLLVSVPLAAQTPAKEQGGSTPQNAPGADAAFIRQAAMSSMAEVEHGRAATQNAASSDVKQFGQRMIDDHSKAHDELKRLASSNKIELPAKLDQKHQAMQDKLDKMKGDAFDKAYMSHMVAAHKEALALFQREAKSGKDADTRAWAEKALPTIQEHLKMAQEISAKTSK